MRKFGKIVCPDCGHVRGFPFGVGDYVNLDGEAPASAIDPSITQSGSERGSDEFILLIHPILFYFQEVPEDEKRKSKISDRTCRQGAS